MTRLARVAMLAFTLAFGPVAASAETAAPTSESRAESPVRYRRVFVPAEHPDQWPTNGEQFLPLDRDEFQRLVAAADARSAGPRGPHLISAEYAAHLADGDSLAGTATLRFENVGSHGALAKLAPFSAAIIGARWSDAAHNPPQLGAWSDANGSAMSFGVVAHQGDALHLDWEIPAVSRSDEEIEFALRIPPVVIQTLAIDLPLGYTATVQQGRLESQTQADDATAARWRFRLAPSEEYRLRIRRLGATPASASQKPLVSVAEAHRLTIEGHDYEAELRVDARGPLSELTIRVPASLEIQEVQVNREPVEWRRQGRGEAISVPMPPSATARTVRIKAAASLSLDGAWTLPKVAPLNAFWTEGTATLWIDPALELRELAPRGARLVNIVGIGSESAGEAYRFQAWTEDAEINVAVGRRTPVLQGRFGSAVALAEHELIARTNVKVWPQSGSVYQIGADVDAGWAIEAVDVQPSGVLASWHVADNEQGRRLYLEFRRSPTVADPFSIAIDGRKRFRRAVTGSKINQLQWLRFPQIQAVRSLLAVSEHRGGKLVAPPPLMSDVVDADGLSAEDAELFDDPSGAMLIDAQRADGEARVRIASRVARFQAEALVHLEQTATGFEHRAEITCRPTFGALDEAFLAFSRPLPPDAQWRTDAEGAQLIVERVPEAAPGANLGPQPAVYRAQFGKPIKDPFQLTVAWSGERQDTDAVNAVVMPGAETWQAWAVLHGDPRQVEVAANGYAPAAGKPAASGVSPPVVACYRLGDDPVVPPLSTPTMKVVASISKDEGGLAFCWYAEVNTLQFGDGAQVHEFEYHLEPRGAEQVRFTPSDEMEVIEATVDGDLAAVERTVGSPNEYRVRLPKDRQAISLVLRLHARRAPLDGVATITPPMLKTSFAVLRGRWTLRAPPRFALEQPAESPTKGSWLQRLFGPLVQDESGGPWSMPAALGAPRNLDRAAASAGRAPVDGAATRGWNSTSRDYTGAPAAVSVRPIDGDRARWFAIGTLSAACAISLGRRFGVVMLLIAGAAAACLVLPPVAANFFQAVFLGLLLGIVVRTVIAGTQRQQIPDGGPPTVAMGLLIALALMGAQSHAAEPPAVPPSVMLPIDQQGNAAGADVYLPADLLAKWRAAAAPDRGAGAVAMVVGARYEITLERANPDGKIECSSGVLTLRCEALRPGARLTLPLDKKDARWLASRHTIDGEPIELVWNPDGKGAVIDLAQVGVHELRLQGTPIVEQQGGRARMKWSVPPAPGAVVEIKHAFGLSDVVIDAALEVPGESSSSRTVARLTDAPVLEASWPAIAPSTARPLIVEQLAWLHVQRGAAYMDLRLRLEGDAEPIEFLQLATAPQIRLAAPEEDSPIHFIETSPGTPTLVRLKFRQAQRLPMSLALRFYLQRTAPTGRIAYPAVNVQGATTRKSHFAVSADPQLRTRDESGRGLAPLGAAEFESLWSVAPGKAAAQYAVTDESPAWSMQVEPVALQSTASETLSLACHSTEAQVEYVAAVNDVVGERHMCDLTVPPDVRIDQLEIVEVGKTNFAAARWTRPAPDRLSVFLGAPLAVAHTVRVVGSVAYDDAGRLSVPRIAMIGPRTSAIELIVRRASEAAVSWVDGPPGKPLAPAAMRDGGEDLLVGRYAASPAELAVAELQVAPNDLQWSAEALVTLEPARSERAVCVLQAKVTRGALDRIRFIVSEEWRAPFAVSPSGEIAVSKIPDESRRLVEVRLADPVSAGESLSLRLSGDLELAADRRTRMPQMRIAGAASQRIYVGLPPTRDRQTTDWTLAGLRRDELPASLQDTREAASAGATYRTLRDTYVAEQKVFPDAMRGSAVWLTATRGVVDADGALSAVAEIIIQPGPAERCSVALPEGAVLLSASVNDSPIAFPKLKGDMWESPPAPPYLPRIITIGYRQPAVRGRSALTLPPVEGVVDGRKMAAEHTIWQIETSRGPLEDPVASGRELSRDQFTAVRRQQLAAAVTSASPLALQLPEWESQAWIQPWLRRLPEQAALDLPWAAMWTSNSDLAGSEFDEPAGAGDDPRGRRSWYESAPGAELVVDTPADWSDVSAWLAAAGILTVCFVAAKFPAHARQAARVIARWPLALGVLGGLFWWMALAPSGLGLVVAGLSAAAMARSRFKLTAAPRAEADTAATAVL